TYAAIDVEPDSAWADDAVLGVGGYDAAHRQTISLVDVGHGERGLHDAGERRAIRQLVQRGFTADGGDQLLVGHDETRHAHPGLGVRRNPPEVRRHVL